MFPSYTLCLEKNILESFGNTFNSIFKSILHLWYLKKQFLTAWTDLALSHLEAIIGTRKLRASFSTINAIKFSTYGQINPIPAGVLENQDMLQGGGSISQSKSHVWCPNMKNNTSLESSCALLLESAKKFANLQKLSFLSQNPVTK